jgi:hypothetical protein
MTCSEEVNHMDWIFTLVTALALLMLVSPILMLLATVFILVPLAHLAPRPMMLARSSFDCPFSKRRANVEFVTHPEADRPTDVARCSVFSDGGVRCKKGCLALAEAAWAPTPMASRFALIAGGTAYR